ncbi:MAG: hypothetical protein U1F61_30655 [Opitutaceae bacterium]
MKLTALTLVVTVGGVILPVFAASPIEPRLPSAGGIHRLTLLTPAPKVDDRLAESRERALVLLRAKARLVLQLSREVGADESSLRRRAELQRKISDLEHAIQELSPRPPPEP